MFCHYSLATTSVTYFLQQDSCGSLFSPDMVMQPSPSALQAVMNFANSLNQKFVVSPPSSICWVYKNQFGILLQQPVLRIDLISIQAGLQSAWQQKRIGKYQLIMIKTASFWLKQVYIHW